MKALKFLKINSSLFIAKFFLLFLAINSFNLHAQNKVHNALLWKITGNSLLKPSFLYGTIHLQDKRLFNFSDSLYSFLQHADGFAMEIHPDSVISAIVNKASKQASEELLKGYLKKSDYDLLSRKLKKDHGIDADNLTVREAYLLKEHLSKPESRADDMPTFVDAYLFGMARNQGKEIVGLEKVQDQVDMFDDVRGKLDVREMVKGMKKEKAFTEQLVQFYLREDLQAIHEMMQFMPAETEEKMLTIRNHVMVARMDSLMRQKSFVVAVGTAHLPGEKGIIELLRKKGYNVEPVFTTSRTHANDYAVKAQQKIQWVDVNEPRLGYSVRMPFKPSPVEMLNGSTKMNMYLDLTSMKVYYTAFVVPGVTVTTQNADSVLQAMRGNVMKRADGKIMNSKRFKKDGFEGIDFVYKDLAEDMYVRWYALAMGKRIYLVGFGAPKKEMLDSQDAQDFFASFKLQDMPLQSWQSYDIKEHYFSISLPDAPKINAIAVADSSIYSTQVSSVDNSTGSFYGATIVAAAPGYIVPNDSGYFANTVEKLGEKLEILKLEQTDTLFNGFNAKSVYAELKDNLLLESFMISRGNRVYTLLAVYNRQDSSIAQAQAFFDSFSFIDYPQLKWKEKKDADLGFTVPDAGQFSKIKYLDENADSLAANRDFSAVNYDSVSAMSYFVTKRKLSPYMWARHDTLLLLKYLKDLTNDDEVMLDKRFVRNGNSTGLEVNFQKKTTKVIQRIRLLLNGNSVYLLQVDAPADYWKKYDYGKMTEGFRFVKEEKTDWLKANSFEKLVTALKSEDSATYTQAYDALDDIIVDSTNLQQLIAAACQEYPVDSVVLAYKNVGSKMLQIAASVKSSKFNQLLEAQYNSLKPQQEQFKFELLGAIANNNDEASMALVQKLLKKGLPNKGNAHAFTAHLYDSLQLTKTLYPWLLSLTSDTLLAGPLFAVHKKMLDSEFISLNDLKPYYTHLLQGARNELVAIAKDTTDFYYSSGLTEMINIISELEADSAGIIMQQFVNTRFVTVKYYAAIDLLKKKKTVPPSVLLSIAADTVYRTMLYQEMQKLKIEKQFPVKYLNRRAFAESYLYNAVEDTPERIEFAGERTVMFKGKKQKFLLYKLIYGDTDDYNYLGISGAFDTDTKSFLIKENVSGFYGEETFDKSLIDSQLKTYLSWFEESEEN